MVGQELLPYIYFPRKQLQEHTGCPMYGDMLQALGTLGQVFHLVSME